MKHIIKNIALGAALLPVAAVAQTEKEYTDSVASQVNVAFRTVNEADLMGGVSTVNMIEQAKKDYTTYSLDGMDALVGGYNGQLWNIERSITTNTYIQTVVTTMLGSNQNHTFCSTATIEHYCRSGLQEGNLLNLGGQYIVGITGHTINKHQGLTLIPKLSVRVEFYSNINIRYVIFNLKMINELY